MQFNMCVCFVQIITTGKQYFSCYCDLSAKTGTNKILILNTKSRYHNNWNLTINIDLTAEINKWSINRHEVW